MKKWVASIAMVVSGKMKGRPITRDEERRITAHTSGGRVGNQPPPARRSSHTILRVEEFVALFVLGMLGGIAVVFIARFVL
jgi:hypothetical protein